jgi:uncharacterized membrane protein YebE (DUF533 family)
MLDRLTGHDRLLLLKFLCAFAWTDLKISEHERAFVERLVQRFGLGGDDAKLVEEWLAVAPSPGSLDPSVVPLEHRRVFVDAVRALIYSDGSVDDEERANFERLRVALEGGRDRGGTNKVRPRSGWAD